MKETTVSGKGQVVIPSEIRAHLGIQPGTKVVMLERDGELVLVPRTKALLGRLKGFLAKDKDKLDRAYREYKNEERLREEAKMKMWGKP